MLAQHKIPDAYLSWNRHYGAPFGFASASSCKNAIARRLGLLDKIYKWDPFAFQPNSSTRAFEYPWAFFAAESEASRILEIGGGLSGFQFVMDRLGHSVVNVDPGRDELKRGWEYSLSTFQKLNDRFGTNVKLVNMTIEEANFPGGSFDTAYAISVLEHVPPNVAASIVQEVWRVLKPGGLFVVTVDLFLNLTPFTSRVSNEFGSNLDLYELAEQMPFMLHSGVRSELNGFPEFDPDRILGNVEKFIMASDYPVLSQCMILKKANAHDRIS